MAFGLVSAPSTFQLTINKILGPVLHKHTRVYLDDVIIRSNSFEEHLRNLDETLSLLNNAGIKLSYRKCCFVREKVKFLGHILSEKGILPNPDKVNAVVDMKRPNTVRQLRRFLGMAGFYRKFINNFAKLALPLSELTKDNVAFKWSEDCESSFKILKNALVEAPVLAAPNLQLPFELHTDASGLAVAGVLMQMHNGSLQPVAYFSRKLKGAELRYSATDKEALAVLLSVRKFHHFLWGSRFKVVTDHRPLLSVFKKKTKSPRMSRWSLEMRDYSFEIIYKAGKSHYVPDALSRPVFQIKQTECSRTDVTMLEGYTASEMRSEQMKEGRWKELICFLEGGKLPNKRPSRSNLQEFQMQNGILYCIRVSEDGSLLLRLVVPQHLRKYALIIAHDSKLSGHPGPRRTFSRAVDQFYWPSMLKDCCDYAKSCRLCQERKGTKGLETKLQALPEVSVPLQRLSLDLTDLHGSNLSFRYVLTMVDAYSRFVIFTPLRNKCASTVTKAMLKYVLTFGAPSLFYSDRGKEFQALIFQQACADLNIKTAMTLPYCPQSNAITERIHGTLKTTLSIL